MTVNVIQGDCRDVLKTLPAKSVHCVVTSPPYFGLRDYDVDGQIGLEPTPGEFVQCMVEVFREVRRVLRDDGTLWLNLGDSYSSGGRTMRDAGSFNRGNIAATLAPRPLDGLKPKDLIGIPWRVAFALQADGWYLRSDIIWHKPNPMPESVRDRPTCAHEHIFLFAKSKRYFYDADAIVEDFQTDPRERYEERARITGRGDQGAALARGNDRGKSGGFPPRKRGVPPRHAQYASSDQSGLDAAPRGQGRNKRNVWTVAPKPFRDAHFATFPPALIEPCILAGCPTGGTVLDPFFGAGTTGLVAEQTDRDCIGIELNVDYVEMAERRIAAMRKPSLYETFLSVVLM